MQRNKWVKDGNFEPIPNYVYIMKKLIYRHADELEFDRLQINGFNNNQVSIAYYRPSKELFDVCMNQRIGFTNFTFTEDREDKWCVGIKKTYNKNKLSELIEIIDYFDSLEEIKNEIYNYLEISPAIQKHEKAKMKKKMILENAPLILLKRNEKPDCVNAFLSQTYSDIVDPNTQSEIIIFLTKRITECSNYQAAPIMAPLLYVIALSSMRGSTVIQNTPAYKENLCRKLLHKPNIEDKKFKTILSIDPTFVGAIAYMDNASGAYTYKHSLFATVKNEKNTFDDVRPEVVEIVKSIDPTLTWVLVSTIFHELAHYAAIEVMNNPDDAKPFEKNDLETKNEYLTIFQNIKEVYQTWVPENEHEAIAIQSISLAFDKSYRENKQPNELFVKIPEIIGFLGYQDGLTVLKKFVPALVEFYEKKFNPACIKSLIENNLEMFIAVDPHFTNELKRYKTRATFRNVIEPDAFSSSSFFQSNELQNEYSTFSKAKTKKDLSFNELVEPNLKIGFN